MNLKKKWLSAVLAAVLAQNMLGIGACLASAEYGEINWDFSSGSPFWGSEVGEVVKIDDDIYADVIKVKSLEGEGLAFLEQPNFASNVTANKTEISFDLFIPQREQQLVFTLRDENAEDMCNIWLNSESKIYLQNSQLQMSTDAIPYETNKWSSFDLVYDRTAKSAMLYVNGSPVGSVSTSTDKAFAGFYIGAFKGNTSAYHYVDNISYTNCDDNIFTAEIKNIGDATVSLRFDEMPDADSVQEIRKNAVLCEADTGAVVSDIATMSGKTLLFDVLDGLEEDTSYQVILPSNIKSINQHSFSSDLLTFRTDAGSGKTVPQIGNPIDKITFGEEADSLSGSVYSAVGNPRVTGSGNDSYGRVLEYQATETYSGSGTTTIIFDGNSGCDQIVNGDKFLISFDLLMKQNDKIAGCITFGNNVGNDLGIRSCFGSSGNFLCCVPGVYPDDDILSGVTYNYESHGTTIISYAPYKAENWYKLTFEFDRTDFDKNGYGTVRFYLTDKATGETTAKTICTVSKDNWDGTIGRMNIMPLNDTDSTAKIWIDNFETGYVRDNVKLISAVINDCDGISYVPFSGNSSMLAKSISLNYSDAIDVSGANIKLTASDNSEIALGAPIVSGTTVTAAIEGQLEAQSMYTLSVSGVTANGIEVEDYQTVFKTAEKCFKITGNNIVNSDGVIIKSSTQIEKGDVLRFEVTYINTTDEDKKAVAVVGKYTGDMLMDVDLTEFTAPKGTGGVIMPIPYITAENVDGEIIRGIVLDSFSEIRPLIDKAEIQ